MDRMGGGGGGGIESNIESIPIFAYSPHSCEQVEKWAERCFTQQFSQNLLIKNTIHVYHDL
jgi:hypothetical protein